MTPRRPERSLDATQAWLQGLLLDENSPCRSRIPERILPSDSLTAAERVAIYRRMIAARFQRTLAEGFPFLRHLAGEAFDALCAAFLSAHPSRSYTLADLGTTLPDFVARWEGLAPARRAPLSDVARFELAAASVDDLPTVGRLDPADLDRIEPEAWEVVRLRTLPSLVLLELAHDVGSSHASWRQGGPGAEPLPKRRHYAFWRDASGRRRLRLDRRGFALLATLAAGLPLSIALERCGATRPERVRRWLLAWTGAGIFRRVDPGRKPGWEEEHPNQRPGDKG